MKCNCGYCILSIWLANVILRNRGSALTISIQCEHSSFYKEHIQSALNDRKHREVAISKTFISIVCISISRAGLWDYSSNWQQDVC